MLHLEVSIHGPRGEPIERVLTSLERMAAELPNFERWLYPEMVSLLEGSMREEFEGASTRPLSEAYARWKAEHFPGKPALQLTGSMFDALTSSEAAHARRSVTKTDLIFGTRRLPYASYAVVDTGVGQPPDESRLAQEGEARLQALMEREGLES